MSNNSESTSNRPEEENQQGATHQPQSAQSEPNREEEIVQPSQEVIELAQQLLRTGFSFSKKAQQQAESLAQNVAEVQMNLIDDIVNQSLEESTLAKGLELQENPAPLMDKPQNDATELIKNIPFEYLIGAPLSAAIKAQSAAARETVHFIETVGFEDKKLRSITFQYDKSNGMLEKTTVTLTVPLLTIVPIPFLRIEDMNINFKAKINAVTKEDYKNSSELVSSAQTQAKGGGWGWIPSISLTGSITSKNDSSSSRSSDYSVEYTMDVNIHATQDKMPAGMQLILNKLGESINEVPDAKGAKTTP